MNIETDSRAVDQAAARRLVARLTLPQRATLAADTQYQGEIACGYGVTAGVILWALRIVRRRDELLRWNTSHAVRSVIRSFSW